MTSSHRELATTGKPVQFSTPSGELNMISNAGFETGSFSPWVNQGGTSYNQIQSSRVYSGTYALYMESHLTSAPYEPVYQILATQPSLAEAHSFSAAVYPTKVGNTAGQAGVDQISLSIKNTATEAMSYIYYEWSGYTYPGGFVGVNVTSKVLYLLFDLVPNQWNLIERDLLSDYTAFFGAPEDASELVILEISLLSHVSNGDPGDFWIDDIGISTSGEPEPTTTADTTSTTTTSPSGPSTSTTSLTNITSPSGDWMILVFVGGGGMGVIIIVVIIILTKKGSSPSGGMSAPYEW